MTKEDLEILSVLDQLPRKFPNQKIFSAYLSPHRVHDFGCGGEFRPVNCSYSCQQYFIIIFIVLQYLWFF